MLKLLWIGDAADTGFGTVTMEIGRRLLDAGHDVRFVLMNRNAEPLAEPFATRSWDRAYIPNPDLAAVLRNGFRDGWRAEQVVMLADYAAARDTVAADPDAWAKARAWHYVPVEGTDLSPRWARFWEILSPVAITAFGAAEITRLTGRPTPYIWHGVDHEVFHPAGFDRPIRVGDRNIYTKREAKANFDLNPDHVILLRTDRYMPRKNYPALFRVVAPIVAERDDVDLLVHCRAQDFGGDLQDEVAKAAKRYGNSVLRHMLLSRGHDTWRGVPRETLAALYNAADLYVSTGSEGFGLTVAEAMACGVPAVGVAHSALPEVIGEGGVLVPVGKLDDNTYNHQWASPDEAAYTAVLRELIDNRAKREALGKAAVAQAARFSWDAAARQFVELLEGECVPASIAEVSSQPVADAQVMPSAGDGRARGRGRPRLSVATAAPGSA